MVTATASLRAVSVRIPIGGGIRLDADVTTPPDTIGMALFAHGSGSSRHSPRNCYVASQLNFLRIGTVLADLLTPEEEQADEYSRALRFDIPMLTRRVVQLIDWVHTYDLVGTLPIGLFGASTGAAAALDAAAARPEQVRAVVSRGGRPDLAKQLEAVRAPTLLIVGGEDYDVLRMNGDALARLDCTKQLEVVPGATHLFPEPGALERVASLAGAWFQQHLTET